MLTVTLGLVHGSVGRRIDDDIGGIDTDSFGQARQVGQVATVRLAASVQRQQLPQRGQAALQFPAYLTVLAQQQHLHAERPA
ncbi:hypothetical protein D3C79_973870 [compost metagenome]